MLDAKFANRSNSPLRKGRNVQDGYLRGTGLEFGKTKELVYKDPLYIEAYKLAAGRTILEENRRVNLFLLLKYYLASIPFGHIVEFGSYKGGNAIFMAYIVKQLYPGMKVYGLDTFAGMPVTDKNIDLHSQNDFSDTSYDDLCRLTDKLKLDNLIWVKGLFEDTTPGVIADAKQFTLAHIDCDIYEAVKYSYLQVKPAMVDGGYVVFDDATFSSCLGATEAVEEILYHQERRFAEQVYPHFVFRMFKTVES